MLKRLLLMIAVLWLSACAPAKLPFLTTDMTGAKVGGPLALTDHTGKPRQLADFLGKVVVVFFGYTQCPDVCPTNMSAMRQVIDQLGPEGEKVQVIFVTVDPERDKPELLAQYVPTFHPNFIGLYGTPAQTAAVTKDFRIFYQKRPGQTPETYTVDHSAGSYVFDPKGQLRLYLKHAEKPETIVADVRRLLAGE